MKKTVVIVSGGFDPLHSGHINYLESAARLGDKLIVALNSDKWLTRKKGRPFMEFEERACIIDRLDMVDNVWGFDDEDGSAKAALEQAKKAYPDYTIVFCNGGDRTEDNIPEMEVEGIQFAFGVGGTTKSNSSSWILKEWKYPTERRVWGEFSDLFQDSAVKVKELVIEPGKGISYQRHFKRSEMWFVSKGECTVKHGLDTNNPKDFTITTFTTDEVIHIKKGDWHQIVNESDQQCHIIEIQYGEETTEDDIERLEYYDGEK
jgi:D-beta-D-heptose 7-phosphate kinase/D-beta-D-heptose 1-phosphate adenosyltransferase